MKTLILAISILAAMACAKECTCQKLINSVKKNVKGNALYELGLIESAPYSYTCGYYKDKSGTHYLAIEIKQYGYLIEFLKHKGKVGSAFTVLDATYRTSTYPYTAYSFYGRAVDYDGNTVAKGYYYDLGKYNTLRNLYWNAISYR